MIYLGQIARFTESDFGGSGSVEAGDVLSFGATVGVSFFIHKVSVSSFNLSSWICSWMD